jgi:cyanate lyase
LDNRGEVCLEEEVERRRRSGMSTEDIAQDMGVDPAWVQSLVSMVEGADTSEANNHKPEETEA